MGNGFNAEIAETLSALRRGIQEHSPFGLAQGKQEWLCHKGVWIERIRFR
jgi:hypothetical protein